MKRVISLFVIIILVVSYNLTAQVAINTDGSLPDSSAMLDVKSIDKGLLLPRMSDSLINLISSPAAGLIAYNTTLNTLVYFDGEKWRNYDGTVLNSEFPTEALFVSPNGTDDIPYGTQEAPFLTISYALERAVILGSTDIIIANGIYNETCEMENGVNMFGGYNATTWKRNLSTTQSIIKGTETIWGHNVTIVADGITNSTVLEGFIIYGINSIVASSNSYVVYINNSSNQLEAKSNVIFAGNGGPQWDGSRGIDGIDGNNGIGRDSNPTGYDAFIIPSSICSDDNNRQYDNGGFMFVGADNISGGNGGGNQCSPIYNTETSGSDGNNGQSNDGGGASGLGGDAGDDGMLHGGSCYIPSNPSIGNNGTNGTDGINGSGGIGGFNTAGTIVSGHWIGASGNNGNPGGNGGGGGGGGAGGGGECDSGCTGDYLGGHGGGGGSGAGGGSGGTGGFGGGGSFGIFILNGSAPVLENNMIYLGNGGRGGNGGFGGTAGVGGMGGSGGICPDACFCYWNAGDGGNGGNGGFGGGGGGGCGGNAFGIYTNGVSGSPNYEVSNSFSGGVAGTAGGGGYYNGTDGLSGIVVNSGNY